MFDEIIKVTMIVSIIYEVSNHMKLWCAIGYTWQRISDARLFAILAEYQKTDRWGGYLSLPLLQMYRFGSATPLGFVTFPPLRSFIKYEKKKLQNEEDTKSRRAATRRMLCMKFLDKCSPFLSLTSFWVSVYLARVQLMFCYSQCSTLGKLRQHVFREISVGNFFYALLPFGTAWGRMETWTQNFHKS